MVHLPADYVIISVAFSSDKTCDDAKTVSVSAPPNSTTSGLWVVPRLAHRISRTRGSFNPPSSAPEVYTTSANIPWLSSRNPRYLSALLLFCSSPFSHFKPRPSFGAFKYNIHQPPFLANMGALGNLTPLVILFAFVGFAAYIGYHVRTASFLGHQFCPKLQLRTVNLMANVVPSRCIYSRTT